jgi:hypothetical protein
MKPNVRAGAFIHKHPTIKNYFFNLMVGTNEGGYEHVSVSLVKFKGDIEKPVERCPTWGEMSFIKDLFWREDEEVIQYHPAKSEYVNLHPYCLHLWRPLDEKIPTPSLVV